ncbi:hypothetical protein HWV62_23452 [Athelia sp. TMB]|nr:hypothetical protein HWV62_23452 [Athelia sp. TMB]
MSGIPPEGNEIDNSVASQLAGNDIANLYSAIVRDKVYGLNLSVPEDAQVVIKPWHEREGTDKWAESGVDDQVVFHIPFSQNVRLRSIFLKIGRGESTPQHLQIFANHPQIVDFGDAESTRAQLDISLSQEVGVVEYPLRAAAFASVNTLSLFFSDSVGGEVSRIYYIGFKGDTRFERRDANAKLDIRAANAPDASITDRVTEKAAGQQTTAR